MTRAAKGIHGDDAADYVASTGHSSVSLKIDMGVHTGKWVTHVITGGRGAFGHLAFMQKHFLEQQVCF